MEATSIIFGIVGLVIGGVISYFLAKKSVDKENQILIDNAKRKAEGLIEDATKKVKQLKRKKYSKPKKSFLN